MDKGTGMDNAGTKTADTQSFALYIHGQMGKKPLNMSAELPIFVLSKDSQHGCA